MSLRDDPAKMREYMRNWKRTHEVPEKRRAYQNEYYRLNHERMLPKTVARNRQYRARLKLATLNAYGGPICACCGETHLAFLTLDHINGGGGAERKKRYGSGMGSYQRLKKAGFPSGMRVLCMNCNAAVGWYGYCPHGNINPVQRACDKSHGDSHAVTSNPSQA